MEIQDVIKELKQLKQMRDLDAEKYAAQGGWAEVVARGKIYGKEEKIGATQLRRVFHNLKDTKMKVDRKQEEFNLAELALLMPRFAYAAGRKNIPHWFYEILTICFGKERCRTREDFIEASNFLEAIMGYHKYYTEAGGKSRGE